MWAAQAGTHNREGHSGPKAGDTAGEPSETQPEGNMQVNRSTGSKGVSVSLRV